MKNRLILITWICALVVFENCSSCGDFVKTLPLCISEEKKHLFRVRAPNRPNAFVIDFSVYSKYQNFRIIFSSKFGRNDQLYPSKENQFPIVDSEYGQYQLFLDSLVSDKNFVVNITSSLSGQLTLAHQSSNERTTLDHHSCSGKSTRNSVPAHLQNTVSHISQALKPLINDGWIRNVKFYENVSTSASVLIFEPADFKFCRNINKNHLRNNVFFTYNLKSRLLYQKCFKCTGYTSAPLHLTLWLLFNLDKLI